MSASPPITGRILKEQRHVIAALRVLVLAGLAMLGVGTPPKHQFHFWALVVVYGVTIFGYLWAKNRHYELRRIKWLVFLFDIGLVSALIVLRGESASEFLLAYFGLVLMAAMAEGLGNAVTNALFVSAAYALLTRWGAPAAEFLTFSTISQFAFFFIVAVFMGHLAQEARLQRDDQERTREELRSTSSELRTSTEALKAARDALRANDRLATLGMLSAGIAHEMRSPLAAILGNLEPGAEAVTELEERVAGDADSEELVAELRSIMDDCEIAGRQLARVASNLTSSARKGPVASVPVRPAESIDSVLRLMRKRTGDGVQVESLVTTERCVRADPGHVLQVLANLITNALDAMEGMDASTVRRIRVLAEDASPTQVRIVVEDTGPGIPDDVKARILDPFFTTKEAGKGTGLGLHIVSEIVKAHRGSIEVESRLGEGSRFVVTLPALAAPGASETSHDRGSNDSSHRRRRGDNSPRAASNPEAGALQAAARV